MRVFSVSPVAIAAALVAVGVAAPAVEAASTVAGLVVHRRPFLLNPDVSIGFETATSATSHEENGVRVSYVGVPQVDGVWTTSQAAEGRQSWYMNGGGFGFTRLQFASDLRAFQFAAGSGWQATPGSPIPHLQFRLFDDGRQIAEGRVGPVPYYSGFEIFGFSGPMFDELHLQSLSGDLPFDEGGMDALTLDAMAFGGPVIPEPATWAMMILGFGLVGLRARRRSMQPA